MKHIPVLSLSLLILISCQNNKPTSGLDSTINIDLNESVKSQGPATEWIEEIEFIPLETNPDCFISSRERHKLNKKYIVVSSNETVHLFNRDGKHLKSFTKKGRGPGEYWRISNIDFVPDRNEIMVVSSNQKKIFCYDFSGTLTNEIDIPYQSLDMAPIKGGLFACYLGRLNQLGEDNQELNQVEFLDRKGQVISKYLPYKYPMVSTVAVNFTCSGEEGVYFINPAYSYDIYQAGPGNQFFVKYRFSYGEYSMDTSLLNNKQLLTTSNPDQLFGPKFMDLDHLTITSNTISLWGPIKQTNPVSGTRQINRESGNMRFMELGLEMTYGSYEGLPIEFSTESTGDYFVSTMDAIQLKDVLTKLTPDQKKALSKFKGFSKLGELKEDDNPILILYKVKDF